jgi:hypothetical protein
MFSEVYQGVYCFPTFRVNCLSVLFTSASSTWSSSPATKMPRIVLCLVSPAESYQIQYNLYLLRLDLVVPFVLVYLIIISSVIGKIPRFDFLEKKSHYSRLLSNLSFRKRDMISLLLISSSRGRLWLKHCKSWRRSHHRRCGRNRLATSGCG